MPEMQIIFLEKSKSQKDNNKMNLTKLRQEIEAEYLAQREQQNNIQYLEAMKMIGIDVYNYKEVK
jgi:hypothetical protein